MPRDMQAVVKMYDVIKWLIPCAAGLPRAHKFTLGDRMTNLALDVLMTLVEAQYTRQKLDLLRDANRKLEQLRYLLRLCKDLELFSINRYEYIAREINETGSFIGGWVKQQEQRR